MVFSNKKENRKKTSMGATPKMLNPDFINYATHFNRKTLLTKNGELVQTIRVAGLGKNGDQDESISIRDKIRDAIYDNINDENKFSFWFHTIRRKKNVATRGSEGYDDFLSSQVNKQWNDKNEWHSQYVNELYISIITQSAPYIASTTKKSFSSHFSYGSGARNQIQIMKDLEKDLSQFTNTINIELSELGSKILGLTKWKGQYFSEPLRFLGKIINLKEERYPVTFNDISKDLAQSKIVFGNRDVQVINHNKSNFCAVLSLKEYVEVPLELMDKILNLNFEFTITQSFDLFSDKKQLENYQSNLDVLEMSEDRALKEISGLSEYENFNKRPNKHFGSLQTTITIITNSYDKLEDEVADALEEFGALGLIMVREDVFLEHCYWSRLPGNFSYLKRQKTINTLKVPGFSAINSFPTGSYDANKWGPAVTTLKTIIDTPYFFNFHTADSGNTIIQGPKKCTKNTFTNFLICQARKLDCDIYFIDSHNSNKAFSSCLQGDYHEIKPGSQLDLNPFSLEPSEANIKFIQELLHSMSKFLKGPSAQSEIDNAQEIIRSALSAKSSNFLVAFDALRTNETKNLYEKLKTWASDKFSYVFGAQSELSWESKVMGFDFSAIIKQKPVIIPIFKYILHRIFERAERLDKPTMIVIDEPLEFLNNPIFEEQFAKICASATKANCTLILKNSNEYCSANKKLVTSFFKNCDTKIFYPPSEEEAYDPETFLIDENEAEALHYMALNNRENILIEKNDIPIIIKTNLEIIDDYNSILSCDPIAKISIDEIINGNPEILNDPQALVKEILDITNEIKNLQEKEEEESRKAIIIKKSEQD